MRSTPRSRMAWRIPLDCRCSAAAAGIRMRQRLAIERGRNDTRFAVVAASGRGAPGGGIVPLLNFGRPFQRFRRMRDHRG